MPSANKTPNINLNNWSGNERVQREDFCQDNLVIDREVGELKTNLGNKETLTTSKKDDLVVAINEVNTKVGKLVASYAEVTLEVAKWSGQTYSLEATYPSATYDIEIELSGNATKDIAKVWGKVIPVPSPDGKNIIKALGTVPTINIPIRVKVVKK